LTRRANQAHIGTIVDIMEPAPETVAGFSLQERRAQGSFNFLKPVRRVFLTGRKWFDTSGKSPA
jgi:hypothetical protein